MAGSYLRTNYRRVQSAAYANVEWSSTGNHAVGAGYFWTTATADNRVLYCFITQTTFLRINATASGSIADL